MLLRRVYHEGLAQASYVVGCEATHQALVIDPNRDINQYLELAEREHVQIVAVAETHIHADFVSGGRELAQRAKATFYVSQSGPRECQYAFQHEPNVRPLRDGDRFEVGKLLFEVWHTPGHTPEHVSLLVADQDAGDVLLGVFTGDFILVGAVGRPDVLKSSPGDQQQAALHLFDSLQRFRQLPEWIQLWPAHGSGSPCGRAVGDLPQTTLGYELRTNWAFNCRSEHEFIAEVLRDQPAQPPYFDVMKQRNSEGPTLLHDLPPLRGANLDDLAHMLQHGIVLDTRSPAAFATQHIPGTLNLPEGEAFIVWAGWLIGPEQAVGLIGDPDHLADIADELRLIGLNNIHAYWTTDVLNSWKQQHRMGRINRISAQVAQELIQEQQALLLDVRRPDEYAAGNIPSSYNLPLQSLRQNLQRIPTDRPLLVHCHSGVRSNAAASLLSSHTEQPIYLLMGGLLAWRAATQATPIAATTRPGMN